jgi:hypothetical protein
VQRHESEKIKQTASFKRQMNGLEIRERIFEVTFKNAHKTNIRIIFCFFILRGKQQNYRMTLKLTTPIFKNIKKQLTNMQIK